MSLFCLVHGSTQDASGWARLVPELQRRGTERIHLDLLGLGFRLFGEFDLQQALFIVGTHLPRIYRTGERERAGEASVLPLDATEVLLFLFLLDLALAMDVRVVFSTRTSMSFSSMPGTSSFSVMLCSSS
jgi:hypothetical protein